MARDGGSAVPRLRPDSHPINPDIPQGAGALNPTNPIAMYPEMKCSGFLDRCVRSLVVAPLMTALLAIAATPSNASQGENKTMQKNPSLNSATSTKSGYAPVNGLNMYYEIEGSGDPLVYIPPVFGFAGMKSFPALAQRHAVITMDLQGFGRTADIPERPLSIEQNAKDIIALLDYLKIRKADFLGESYGATTAVMIALMRPDLVGRVAAYGGTFGPPAEAHNTEMLHFDRPPTADGESHSFQRDEYRKVAPDPAYWPKLWSKVVGIRWDGFSAEQLASIQAPVLILVGDHDFVRIEHALQTFKRIPRGQMAVVPDAGHFALFSEPEKVIPIVERFLGQPEDRIPIANAEAGYHPGKTR